MWSQYSFFTIFLRAFLLQVAIYFSLFLSFLSVVAKFSNLFLLITYSKNFGCTPDCSNQFMVLICFLKDVHKCFYPCPSSTFSSETIFLLPFQPSILLDLEYLSVVSYCHLKSVSLTVGNNDDKMPPDVLNIQQ